MKKSIKLFCLFFVFMTLGVTDSIGQQYIKNNTGCKFAVTIVFAEECNFVGYEEIIVQANTTIEVSNYYTIIEAKGYPILENCPFYISRPECEGSYDFYDKVQCQSQCFPGEVYKAQFLPGGILIDD